MEPVRMNITNPATNSDLTFMIFVSGRNHSLGYLSGDGTSFQEIVTSSPGTSFSTRNKAYKSVCGSLVCTTYIWPATTLVTCPSDDCSKVSVVDGPQNPCEVQ